MKAIYVSTSETSRDAAIKLGPDLSQLQKKVYNFILSRGNYGAMEEEIQMVLAPKPSTQHPRRIELVRRGEVKSAWIRRKPLIGMSSEVWRVVISKQFEQQEMTL